MSSSPVARRRTDSPQTAHILVVDGEPAIRSFIAAYLAGTAMAVSRAEDARTALLMACEEPPDLILLDVSAPRREDPFVACREFRDAVPTAPPVILLAADGIAAARLLGADCGVVDYMVQPFEPEELRARVKAALRTRAEHNRLRAVTRTDDLTGLANRRALNEWLAASLGLAVRYERPLSCLMIDLDHFKEINDTYGHAAGDAVLTAVARRLGALSRRSDLLARYGGDEFVLLLPDTGQAGAMAVAEKIRNGLAASPLNLSPVSSGYRATWARRAPRAGTFSVQIGASVGVSSWDPAQSHTGRVPSPAALIAEADAALYHAKRREWEDSGRSARAS